MAISKLNYVPGQFETITGEALGSYVDSAWNYFKIDGYFKYELSEVELRANSADGTVLLNGVDYALAVDEYYTNIESNYTGNVLAGMFRILNPSYYGKQIFVSGANFGTMIDNEEMKRYIDNLDFPRNTAELTVSDPSTESHSGTLTKQQAVNRELVEKDKLQDLEIQQNSDAISALASASMVVGKSDPATSFPLTGATSEATAKKWDFDILTVSNDTEIMDADPSTSIELIYFKQEDRRYSIDADFNVSNTNGQDATVYVQAFLADGTGLPPAKSFIVPGQTNRHPIRLTDEVDPPEGSGGLTFYYALWSTLASDITIQDSRVSLRSGAGAVTSSADLETVLGNGNDGAHQDMNNVGGITSKNGMDGSGLWQIEAPEGGTPGGDLEVAGADSATINETYSQAGTRDAGGSYGIFPYFVNSTGDWFIIREGWYWLITSSIGSTPWADSAYYGSGGKDSPIGFFNPSGYNGHTGDPTVSEAGSGTPSTIDSLVALGSIYSDKTIKAKEGLNVGDELTILSTIMQYIDKGYIEFNEFGGITIRAKGGISNSINIWSDGKTSIWSSSVDLLCDTSARVNPDERFYVGSNTGSAQILADFLTGKLTAPAIEISDITELKSILTKEFGDATYGSKGSADNINTADGSGGWAESKLQALVNGFRINPDSSYYLLFQAVNNGFRINTGGVTRLDYNVDSGYAQFYARVKGYSPQEFNDFVTLGYLEANSPISSRVAYAETEAELLEILKDPTKTEIYYLNDTNSDTSNISANQIPVAYDSSSVGSVRHIYPSTEINFSGLSSGDLEFIGWNTTTEVVDATKTFTLLLHGVNKFDTGTTAGATRNLTTNVGYVYVEKFSLDGVNDISVNGWTDGTNWDPNSKFKVAKYRSRYVAYLFGCGHVSKNGHIFSETMREVGLQSVSTPGELAGALFDPIISTINIGTEGMYLQDRTFYVNISVGGNMIDRKRVVGNPVEFKNSVTFLTSSSIYTRALDFESMVYFQPNTGTGIITAGTQLWLRFRNIEGSPTDYSFDGGSASKSFKYEYSTNGQPSGSQVEQRFWDNTNRNSGGGSTLLKAEGTYAGTLTQNQRVSVPVTVTGAAVGDTVVVNIKATSANKLNYGVFGAYVSQANQVQILLIGYDYNTDSKTFEVTVIQ